MVWQFTLGALVVLAIKTESSDCPGHYDHANSMKLREDWLENGMELGTACQRAIVVIEILGKGSIDPSIDPISPESHVEMRWLYLMLLQPIVKTIRP